MSELSLAIFGGDARRAGRPKGSTRRPPGSKVSTWVPEDLHDAIIDLAGADARYDGSVSAVLREAAKNLIEKRRRAARRGR